MEAVALHRELHSVAAALGGRAADGGVANTTFGPPVPSPRNVFGIGLNYADHAGEADMALPAKPLVFTKWPSCITGPTASVELRSETADYEAELVVVIGDGGRDVSVDDAWDHVAGIMCGQDISDSSSPPSLPISIWASHETRTGRSARHSCARPGR